MQYRKDGTKAQQTRGNTVTTYNKDGSFNVNKKGSYQYTQKTVRQGRSNYIQRTYTRNNRTYVRNYSTYVYGGYSYYSYSPFVAYDPWFYGYLYHPFYSPFVYSWGYDASPWYGYYGYYYHPYASYYAPSYWLTDFLISDMLSSQYQSSVQQDRAAAADAERAAQDARDAASQARVQNQQATPITEEVKEQIKAQVEEAIRAHEKKEPVTMQTLMTDTKHIFPVSDDLDATILGTDTVCSLTSGDLIRLAEVPAESSPTARWSS